jgi:hypothetical protein
MALTLQQCGFWFIGVGLLTRRAPGADKAGKPTYAGDLAVGTSRQYIKLTDEQYSQVPMEGMEAQVEGNLVNGKEGIYLQTTSVKRFGEPVQPQGKSRI